jgi:hypothetical protein
MEHTTTIKAGGSEKDYWKDLWLHRQLLWILIQKRHLSPLQTNTTRRSVERASAVYDHDGNGFCFQLCRENR